MTNKLKSRIENLLEGTGITINGKNPWDITVHDERFYARVIAEGSLGLGESYMDGWWDCPALDQMFARLLRDDIRANIKPSLSAIADAIKAHTVNLQKGARAYKIGQAHYDLGNDLYTAMLDKRLVYTCGYWKDAKNLDDAQEAKLDLVCKKIGLKQGQKVLDIGCGWGSFAKFAAEKYGATVVGVTVSKEQVDLAREMCKGLPVEIRLQDYRDVNEPFDHIISLGMFEHVGYKNYRTYFEVANRCLKNDGVFLLHTIGGSVPTITVDRWISKYIFPNSMIPSASQITKAYEGLFVLEDWHNFGPYYDNTLMAWQHNFEHNWNSLKDTYGERFHRMWNYYLLCCAGSFRARDNQLWQIALTKKGLIGGYASIR